ncbi:2,5-diamino-6-(ribosylamino)-4(3H)-pyrimidinone 5'-phosphate reductase [Methanolapillus millepedarum]|uniref:2,5-diamino-6-(ribosylamino)-4(3H)-pyrimidinone 5'-phosphate reductase n=1 Tax=Methanolapillus millepedarum TaxID=3028296 RepID=A0AA97A313_9EURY|nr:2,5-diamino-6-ribosylamino-4(3H)-pyrimidinone 5'-phosphate reductase [Methanosarcinaceae archaeon Ac7]
MKSLPSPFILINSAMSADGKLSTKERKQVKISGKADFDRVDALRASSDAIMVGIGTMLSDNPSLTVKSEKRRKERTLAGKDENPVRIVADSQAKTPVDADIFKKGSGKKIIVVSKTAPSEKVNALLKNPDTKVIVADPVGSGRVDLTEMAKLLKKEGIEKLMVEGGATLNEGLLAAGLVDEINIFIGNMIIGGKNAPTFADGSGFSENNLLKLELISFEKIEDGILLKWKVKND